MSGYEGFLRDSFTRLPETRERIAATSVTASWRYSGPSNYDESYEKALAALGAAFFGPASGGVYSPSLQFTLFEMGKGLLGAVPNAESVHLRLPNLHFLPCAPVNSTVGFFFFFFFFGEGVFFFYFFFFERERVFFFFSSLTPLSPPKSLKKKLTTNSSTTTFTSRPRSPTARSRRR